MIAISETQELTRASFITNKDVYDRNHGPIPQIAADSHILRVDGMVAKVLELTVAQLRDDFRHHEVLCALQCAGNRRHTMRTLLKEVDGIDWGDGAVMNCIWKGPRLRDILLRAGVDQSDLDHSHVAFACFQTKCQDDEWYGGSISLQRAMKLDADVLVALEVWSEIRVSKDQSLTLSR